MDTTIKELVINGKIYVEKGSEPQPATKVDGMPYVIVRSRDAGVCAGYMKEKSADGRQVTLVQSRRLWYWKGAASLHQLANEGVKCPKECKFPAVLEGTHCMTDVCEILMVTKKAQDSIAGVPVWQA